LAHNTDDTGTVGTAMPTIMAGGGMPRHGGFTAITITGQKFALRDGAITRPATTVVWPITVSIEGGSYRKLNHDISAAQSAQNGHSTYTTERLDGARSRRVLV
jgi:hypothetical protein